jgi:hypothetical protein
MARNASAFAVLGLEPGADWAAVEQAYKKLIKQHHPDREGGDPTRAAEINRAYRELRGVWNRKDPLQLNDEAPGARRRRGRGWVVSLLLFALAGLGLLIWQNPLAPKTGPRPAKGASRASAERQKAASTHNDPMEQPLHLEAIDGAAGEALRLSKSRDEMALAAASQNCHHLLRRSPSLVQLDRCAAFDDAVIQLQDRDPLRDQGPFSELAVTGRLWNGATALSEDSVAIDGRLGRIRSRVEAALTSVTKGDGALRN